jgi:hypothetical protein
MSSAALSPIFMFFSAQSRLVPLDRANVRPPFWCKFINQPSSSELPSTRHTPQALPEQAGPNLLLWCWTGPLVFFGSTTKSGNPAPPVIVVFIARALAPNP